jgi:phospholipid/cholesterol/gamma-HCH transport system ATP-binding protein
VAGEDVPGRHGEAEGGAGAQGEQEGPPAGHGGTSFGERERARQREREGSEEFEFHTGTLRPSETPDAIEFIDVHKSFGRNHVLRVLVHGVSIPSLADADLFEIRKKFGVLFQDGALFGSLNLWDNVAFPLRQHTEKGDEEIAEIVNRRMSEVGLGGEGEKMPSQLSGGMRKRAGFARALVLDPEIVLFDEPDSGLDPVRTALLCELIKEIHAENGGCYVVITHDIMSARRVAEHISVLWKGRIVESGPAEELFASENPFVRQFLSGASAGPLGME